MPPMTSRRAGARERRKDGRAAADDADRADLRRSDSDWGASHPSSFLIRASRVGMGSAEERRSGGWLGGGGKFFLAFEDDAVEETAAGGGAEHGGQNVGFGFIDLGKGKLESIGAGGAVPAGALIFESGDGADPGVGQ